MGNGWNASPQATGESGWVARLFQSESSTPEYQQLKFALHQQLLERLNLEALSSIPGERARLEIRTALVRLVDQEKTPLSRTEKDRVIEEILDEVFGLGPLEPDRKSTRLNSSHLVISYAVFCLKKKQEKLKATHSRGKKGTGDSWGGRTSR